MNLKLPVVGRTIGPEWALMVNDALERIDQHDHASGSGKLVPITSIRVNADIDFTPSTTAYGVKNLRYARFTDLNAAGIAAPTAESVLFSWKNDLWWNHDSGTGSGTPVQITQKGVLASKTTYFETFTLEDVHGTWEIGNYERYAFLAVHPRVGGTAITLPSASVSGAGKFFIIQDVAGTASGRTITISPESTDFIGSGTVGASVSVSTDYGHYWLTSDGVSTWIRLSNQ